MSDQPWLPFGVDHENSLHTSLFDGVPEWLEQSLGHWNKVTMELFLFRDEDRAAGAYRQIERTLRTSMRMPSYQHAETLSMSVYDHFKSRHRQLELTDYLLSLFEPGETTELEDATHDDEPAGVVLEHLEDVLSESGSQWAVGVRAAGKFGLIHRVPVAVQQAANATMSGAGHAGQRLAEAWGAAFGMSPNPSLAYSLAVKAVEDAAIPALGLPTEQKTTLGTVIRVMNGKDHTASEWTLPLQEEDEHYSNGQTVVAMLKSLWAGQVDRHGGNHEHQNDREITQQAAETALMLAVVLVQVFSSGAVTRK